MMADTDSSLRRLRRGHLDLSTQIKSPPGDLAGVLGKSLYVRPEDLLRDPADRKFHHAGQEAEFIVENLFDALPLTQQSGRGRSLIEGASLNGLSFPLTATFGLGQ